MLIEETEKGRVEYLKTLPLMGLASAFSSLFRRGGGSDKEDPELTATLRKGHVDALASEFITWRMGMTIFMGMLVIVPVIVMVAFFRFYLSAVLIVLPVVFYYISRGMPSQWEKALSKQFGGVRFITFLSLFNVYLTAGVQLDGVFEKMGEVRSFGVISMECRRIVADVRSFGMDVMGAMRESVKNSGSEKWNGFIGGIISTTESGGDVVAYVNSETTRFMVEWDREVDRLTENINIFSEVYATVGNAMPLFLVFMVGLMSVLGAEGSAGPMDTIVLATVIPGALAGVFIWMFGSTVNEGFK